MILLFRTSLSILRIRMYALMYVLCMYVHYYCYSHAMYAMLECPGPGGGSPYIWYIYRASPGPGYLNRVPERRWKWNRPLMSMRSGEKPLPRPGSIRHHAKTDSLNNKTIHFLFFIFPFHFKNIIKFLLSKQYSKKKKKCISV